MENDQKTNYECCLPQSLKSINVGKAVGKTVAIFYPVGHGFLDGTLGVKVKKVNEVFVCDRQPRTWATQIRFQNEIIDAVVWFRLSPFQLGGRCGHE
jgi:hypothetical protein